MGYLVILVLFRCWSAYTSTRGTGEVCRLQNRILHSRNVNGTEGGLNPVPTGSTVQPPWYATLGFTQGIALKQQNMFRCWSTYTHRPAPAQGHTHQIRNQLIRNVNGTKGGPHPVLATHPCPCMFMSLPHVESHPALQKPLTPKHTRAAGT